MKLVCVFCCCMKHTVVCPVTHVKRHRIQCMVQPVAPARSPQTHQGTVNAELLDNQPTPNTSRHFKQDQQTSRFIQNGSPNNMRSILQMPSLTWNQRTIVRNTCTEHDRQTNVYQVHQQTTDTSNKKQFGFTKAGQHPNRQPTELRSTNINRVAKRAHSDNGWLILTDRSLHGHQRHLCFLICRTLHGQKPPT